MTRYHSVEDTTASWQAKMFTGGDFGAAARKYQQFYQLYEILLCPVARQQHLLPGGFVAACEGRGYIHDQYPETEDG